MTASSAYQDFFKDQEDAADGGTGSIDADDDDDGVLVDNVLDCDLYTGCEDDDSDEILDCMIENMMLQMILVHGDTT